MKYATLSLIAVSVLFSALAIGCGSSRPHSDVDTGPVPHMDAGPNGPDMGLPARDRGTITTPDMGFGHDVGTPGHDAANPGRDAGSPGMCVSSCTSDTQCAGTCGTPASGTSYCCMASRCYLSRTMACPTTGHDSGAGGSGG